MIIFILLSVALLAFGCRMSIRGFRQDYLDKKFTTAMNGFFILWVFFRHVQDYIGIDRVDRNVFDKIYFCLDDLLGQRIVVMFLFFSGFGVMESLRNKGDVYWRSMPRKRLLATLVNFDIAVLMFWIFDLLLGKCFGVRQVLFSFVGWDDIGNSNWYIFGVLLCYVATFLGFAAKRFRRYGAWVTLALVIGIILWLQNVKGSWWYNTLLAYPFGIVFAYYRRNIENELHKRYYLWLLVAVVASCFFKRLPINLGGIEKNMSALSFALLCLLLMMKIQVYNRTLEWLGSRLFPIYIYQRLPMMVLSAVLGSVYINNYPYVYVILSLAATLAIAYFYRFWQVKLK